LRERLARVIAYGEMMGPLTVVTGPRGLGKTSLLRDVADQAASDGFVVCWTVGLKRKPFLDELLGQVARAMARTDSVPTPASRRHLEELAVQLNVGLVKVEARANPSGPGPAALDRRSVGQVEEFLGEAARLIRAGGGAGLLVMIDELHAPLEPASDRDSSQDQEAVNDAAVLLNAVQDMAAEKERFPLGVVGAGLPQTKTLLTRVATFAERTREIALPKLDGATSRALLTEPAGPFGVAWSGDALNWAIRQGDGYPQSLQIELVGVWCRSCSGRIGVMSKRYPPEFKDRAVKMVLSHLDEYPSVYAAARAIAPSLGCSWESVRRWVVADRAPARDGAGEVEEARRVRELEREVRDLREANEILKAASIFFAGELDPRRR
jgi:transposase-like protein